MLLSLKRVVTGGFWALLERFSLQFVSFAVTIVLARLLTPDAYGTVSIIMIFVGIASVLANGGMAQGLVQKKSVTDVDFNTVFGYSMLIACIIYVALWVCAPYIARFYHNSELSSLLRVVSVIVILGVIGSVQGAELTRELLFHLSFRVNLAASVVSAIVGIALAFYGWGPWALVWQTVTQSLIGVILRAIVVKWIPRFHLSVESLRTLFSFGWKMCLSSLIDTVYSNLYGLIIGRMYSKADLAFVNRGNSIPRLAMTSINGTLGGVAFPALAQMQDDPCQLCRAMRRMIKVSTFFVFPMMIGCSMCAKPLVLMLFGQQWLPSVPFVQIACFEFALWPFHTINLQAITALGRSDLYLRLEIIKKIMGIVLLIVAIRHGVIVFMAILAFAGGPLGVLINTWPNRRLLGYTISMQFSDVMPVALIACFTGLCMFVINFFLGDQRVVLCVILQFFVGPTIYLTLAKLFKVNAMEEVMNILRTFRNSKGR